MIVAFIIGIFSILALIATIVLGITKSFSSEILLIMGFLISWIIMSYSNLKLLAEVSANHDTIVKLLVTSLRKPRKSKEV